MQFEQRKFFEDTYSTAVYLVNTFFKVFNAKWYARKKYVYGLFSFEKIYLGLYKVVSAF